MEVSDEAPFEVSLGYGYGEGEGEEEQEEEQEEEERRYSTEETAIVEGAISRSAKTTLLKRHLASFEKLLQYAISRYSSEKLRQKLAILQKALQNQPLDEDTPQKVGPLWMIGLLSMSDIRLALNEIKKKAQTRPERAVSIQAHIVLYFEAFFEDLQFLRELKRYFDEKIHRVLYENFYDPFDDLHGGTGDSARAKLIDTAKTLYEISSKWDRVNGDEYVEQSDFDLESLHDIKSFNTAGRFVRIIRIIPDIFVKAFKASDCAKSWLRQAFWVFKDNVKLRTAKEINNKEQELKERVLSLTLEIAQIESDLETEYEGLKVLRHKENRHLELDEKRKKATEIRNRADTRVTELLDERQKLHSQNTKALGPSQSFKDKCMDVDVRILKAENDMRIINFQLTLLSEDYNLEVFLLPEIVTYALEVEASIKSLEATLKNKQFIRQTTEDSLLRLKRNCAKMKEVINKYNRRDNSAISVETNEAGDTLSTGRSDTSTSETAPSPLKANLLHSGDEGRSNTTWMVDRGTAMSPNHL